MSFKALLRPVTVVVEKLFAGFDVPPGCKNEPGLFPEHDHFGLKVGRQPGVVDESSEAPGLRGGVNAAKGSENVVATQALLGLGNLGNIWSRRDHK